MNDIKKSRPFKGTGFFPFVELRGVEPLSKRGSNTLSSCLAPI